MQWLQANWFWVVIGIAFIGMHLFGHGGHGGHGQRDADDRPTAAAPGTAPAPETAAPETDRAAGGHHHH